MTGNAIRRVLVVGGGVVARSAAAAFKRKMPWLDVAIVATAVSDCALADTMISTLPSILGFHADLGLADDDAVTRTGSVQRLGTLFAGWAGGTADYLHAYGPHGQPFGTTSFHLQWARLARQGRVAPFDAYSPAAMLARFGRGDAAQSRPGRLFNDFECGLQLNHCRYGDMLDAFIRHCGVRIEQGQLRQVLRRADGFIAGIALDNGTLCEADLFIDATGPAALLRDRADEDWEDWSHYPGCDRMIRVTGRPSADLPLYDTVTAVERGWHWSAITADQADYGICYSSAFCDDITAAQTLAHTCGIMPESEPITIAAGTCRQPWRRNCVAIGDAATAIEPLEWTNLHLAHSAIDRVLAMLPDTSCASVELAEYNRQAYAEAIRVRDFVVLHYATARRDGAFWEHAAKAPLPTSLTHTLTLFRERGRLPVYEEETFARDSWLAVLFGQGEMPTRIDPLAAVVPIDEVAQAMAGLREAIASALPKSSIHAAAGAAQSRFFAS